MFIGHERHQQPHSSGVPCTRNKPHFRRQHMALRWSARFKLALDYKHATPPERRAASFASTSSACRGPCLGFFGKLRAN